MSRWRSADIDQCRAVGPGNQAQHFQQAANRLVADSAALPGCQCLHCPVGVALEAKGKSRQGDELRIIDHCLFSVLLKES